MQLNRILYMILFIIILSGICSSETEYGAKIIKEGSYSLSRSIITRTLTQGDVFTDYIDIQNLGNSELKATFSVSEGLTDILEPESLGVMVPKDNTTRFNILIKGVGPANYSGTLKITGDINEEVSVNVTVIEESTDRPVLIELKLPRQKFTLGGTLEFNVKVNRLKPQDLGNVTFNYTLINLLNQTYDLGSDKLDVLNNFERTKKFRIAEELPEGDYTLEVQTQYSGGEIVNRANLELKKSFFKIMIFGIIPMWLILSLAGVALFLVLAIVLYKRRAQRMKKYQMKFDLKSIPAKNPDFLYLGKIAETNYPAYLDPNRLTTHSIVAGATGGGKSISAQVIIEEALLHNIAVVVFDPTAQWSGMLRKCTDKKMISYYKNFGLKESDAKAFKGNVRQVKSSREIIDIKKYMTPGQIHIFSLNKLDPNQMDTFVASVIRQIFRSDPQESPVLKVILVFDEVHRLLSKFGGSGEGFLQVERSCREFRKWGMGVMLVSQVLSDFVGEIKANISTEVQMRTRDEGDLNRIKTKYGGDFLQSLVKASVGVGMFVNPTYNHAQPYFINFRPILHNTRRLSDEELDRYNKYNDIIDDLDFQIEQLEEQKIDTFDLKMELKLVKDKVMTGNFSVVEIYLEGLLPRFQHEWEKLGKKPKKREIQLVAEEEIKKGIEEAKKAREKVEKAEGAKQETASGPSEAPPQVLKSAPQEKTLMAPEKTEAKKTGKTKKKTKEKPLKAERKQKAKKTAKPKKKGKSK